MINATQLRPGSRIIFNGEPCRVAKVNHITPGKGAGFVKVKMRSVRTGTMLDKKFASSERIETFDTENREMQYLYSEGDTYHFMDTENYEQVALNADALQDVVGYLVENATIQVELYEGDPIGVDVGMTVDLKVVECAPPLKGATAAASPKPARLETGITVNVPQYLNQGEVIRVDTRTGVFVERVKS